MTLPKEIKDQFDPLAKDAVASGFVDSQKEFYAYVEDSICDWAWDYFDKNFIMNKFYNVDVDPKWYPLKPISKTKVFTIEGSSFHGDTKIEVLVAKGVTHVSYGEWTTERKLTEDEWEREEETRLKVIDKSVKGVLNEVKQGIKQSKADRAAAAKAAKAPKSLKTITLSLTDDQLTRLKDVLDV